MLYVDHENIMLNDIYSTLGCIVSSQNSHAPRTCECDPV